MRSRSNGPFTIIVMVVSMMAVPLLAVFGIPQFVPVDALPSRESGDVEPSSRPAFATPARQAIFGDGLKADASESAFHAEPFFSPVVDRPRPDPFNFETDTAASNTALHDRASAGVNGLSSGFEPRSGVRNEPLTREPLTWRAAVQRLNHFGIRQFRLQPGARAGEFHFSCYYTPSDNPRITHRFEAEAIEPLRAVEKVLAQVRLWAQGRQ